MRAILRLAGFGALALAFTLPVLGADDAPMYKIKVIGPRTVQIYRYNAQVITVGTGKAAQDIYPTDDAKVYLRVPPNMFDDKGNIKRPTSAELAKLKGKNPGYPGDFDALAAQKVVTVNLVQKVLAKPLPKGEKDPEAGRIYYNWVLVQ
jgi:hypothetical protein